jgi:hypothetical protein
MILSREAATAHRTINCCRRFAAHVFLGSLSAGLRPQLRAVAASRLNRATSKLALLVSGEFCGIVQKTPHPLIPAILMALKISRSLLR